MNYGRNKKEKKVDAKVEVSNIALPEGCTRVGNGMTVKLLHGDCREFLPIPADVCITDPPYAVDKNGEMLGQIAANYHDKGTHTRGYHDHNFERFVELLKPSFQGVADSLPKGGSFVAFCGNRTYHQMATIAEQTGFEVVDILVFAGGGSFAKAKSTLSPKHELAMFARKKGGVRQINPTRTLTNFFQIPKTKGESAHPTTKPQSWMRPLVEIFSEPGETILDPYMGSGSTMLAAQSLGRNGVGIELVDEYFRIAKSRISE